MKKGKLTPTQSELLSEISEYMGVSCPIRYNMLYAMSVCKSFDATFNALLNKGYVQRYKTNDFSNQFTLTV